MGNGAWELVTREARSYGMLAVLGKDIGAPGRRTGEDIDGRRRWSNRGSASVLARVAG